MELFCLAGGVALNCVANGRVLREIAFCEIWIQTAAGDTDEALGGAQFFGINSWISRASVSLCDSQLGSRFGPRFSLEECRGFREQNDVAHREFKTEDVMCEFVAE